MAFEDRAKGRGGAGGMLQNSVGMLLFKSEAAGLGWVEIVFFYYLFN